MNATFTQILRIILGLTLLLFAINNIFDFFTMFEMPHAAANFLESLKNSGYVYYIVTFLEIGVGILLLLNKWVPFALIVLAPISINILLFHIFLNVSDIFVAIAVIVINVMLIYKYWRAYRPLFEY